MEKKYKLTDEYILQDGVKLYRIEALKDFRNVRKGDKGGFVENENNLSHNRNCWISEDAKVFGEARVYGNAKISGNAIVYNNAMICGDAEIRGSAKVCDYACVSDNTFVKNNARVFDNAKVSGNSCVCDNAWVFGNANVSGKALVSGNAKVSGDANVCADEDYIVFKNWWSSLRYFTWTKSNNMWKVGCFYGTGEELIKKAYKDSEKSGREYERVVKYVESILSDEKKYI